MNIGIIGAGSWGTALAIHLRRLGHRIRVWVHGEETFTLLQQHRENTLYLPGIALPDGITFTRHPEALLHSDPDCVILAVPSRFARSTLRLFQSAWNRLKTPPVVVSAIKGIESDTLATMTEVIHQEWPHLPDDHLLVLSGPSFAREVAEQKPTAIVIAGPSEPINRDIQRVFHGRNLRVYRNTDRRGVELGGAMKNVIALAAGMVTGAQLGHNALAALITRGLVEMVRLGTAMGALPETFYGLSGIGDLVLTCTGPLSRNRMVGYRLGLGESLSQIMEGFRMAVEGIPTTRALYRWAQQHGIETPIIQAVYRVLYEDEPLVRALRRLLERPMKPEHPLPSEETVQ